MKAFLEKLYFLLIFSEITTALPRIVGGGSSDTAAGHTSNPVLLFFNILVVFGTIWYVYPSLPRIWKMLLQLRWVFLLYLWMVLSVLWSVDRPATLRSSMYSLVYLLSAAYFAARHDTEKLLDRLSQCMLLIAILSVAGEFLLPPTDDPAPGWSGVFLQKNGLGLCMMIGLAILLVQGKRWTFKRAASGALYVALLLLSQSFTAIVATCFIVLFVFSIQRKGKRKVVLWTAVVGTLCICSILANPAELLLGAGGKSSNFTGRDVIWAYALKGIFARPLLGAGYQAFWVDSSDALQVLHWNPHHAHNGFLQVTLDFGLVGLGIMVGFLSNTWRRARKMQRSGASPTALWTLVLSVALLAHNLMESDFMISNLLWYLVILGSFSMLREEKRCHVAHHEPSRPAMHQAECVTA